MVSKPSKRVAAHQAARDQYRDEFPATLFGAPNRAARRDRSALTPAPDHDRSNRSDASVRSDNERARRVRVRRRAVRMARKAGRA